jgi:peptidoglycan/xylan/chitin deacetylase (PgdA/CDA1 family)
VLEKFFGQHPDFGRGGLFSILPLAPFAWPGAPDQLEYAQEKLQWLLANGYELGNHTLGHNNLAELTSEEAMEDLAAAVDLIHEYVPGAPVLVIVLPFGEYPPDESLLRSFDYQGQRYEFYGALMAGAGPALSPAHSDFDPFRIPRILAGDEEFDKWFSYVEDNPGLIYVSDGTP